jgi:hypothetical protein
VVTEEQVRRLEEMRAAARAEEAKRRLRRREGAIEIAIGLAAIVFAVVWTVVHRTDPNWGGAKVMVLGLLGGTGTLGVGISMVVTGRRARELPDPWSTLVPFGILLVSIAAPFVFLVVWFRFW